ncbi:methyl-accepting chemotaxis protein [Roseateles sp. BYS87W]|uniref:Methyl-accepting chemotaxis protein n=1 Tax=Pelomonas baiyunensis TaxID=3299026 RepID=A0ABW7H336_9BURK
MSAWTQGASGLRERLARLATAKKLALAFGWLILLSAVIGVGSLLALSQVRSASSELASRWLPTAGHLAAARAALLEHREFVVKHTTAADAGYMDEYEEKIRNALQTAKQALQDHLPLVTPGDHQALRAEFDKLLAAYLDTTQKVIALDKGGKQDDGKEISDGAGKSSFDDAIAALDKVAAAGFEAGQAAGEASDQLYQRARLITAALLAVALGSGLLLAVLIARSLSGDLGGEPRVAADLLQRIAGGDLTHTVRVRTGDTRSLMASLADMQERLITVVDQVRRGADSVATASQEIASGNSDLSQRTEVQAAALQRTSGAMDQLRQQALGSAENARDASGVATAASGIAAQGGEVVGGVVATMRGISQSSARIAEIIGVIDGIAFQTNILALNAAVEAARAGEQGRGFAVVAGEVRSLAQRSATAAKEIKQLITASVEQIQQGSSQVDRAGATMQQVVEAIQKVDRIVTDISQAGSHQAQQVNDLGAAVSEMDQSTQQNAALVEESAAAAESLRTQAQQLVEAVAFFRLSR